MSVSSRDPGAPRGGALERSGLVAWLDRRAGLSELWRALADEPVPGGARWRYVFGSVLVFLFLQQSALGVLLATVYSPSVSQAWASTAYIQDRMAMGWFLRGLHHHGSSAMVIVVLLHTLQVFWAGAYKAPRELNWWTGLLMGGLVLAFALTGYLLPWDQKGYWATQVATGIMGSVPGGGVMQSLVQGGPEYGNLTLTRFYALHVFVLPLGLSALLGAHLWLFRRHGVTPPAGMPEAELARKTQPFAPHQLFLDIAAMAAVGVALIAATVATHGAELYAPADPASNFEARPEWYFLFLFQLLKFFEGPAQIVGTVILPGLVAGWLVLAPFLDRGPSRKARDRWPMLLSMGALLVGLVLLTAMAIVEDAGNEHHQEAMASAKAEAERTRELARDGVLPEGGLAVWRNDPMFAAAELFREHCKTCHRIDGVGGKEAPTLTDYNSRAWLRGVVREPRSTRYFGGTKEHDEMEAYDADALPDADLDAVIEYMLELRGDGGDLEQALVARGRALWPDLDCGDCHETEAGKGGGPPNLAGRGSRAWIARVIANSSAEDLYEADAEMPEFADKLTEAQIEQLAAYVYVQGWPAAE
jgi:ubiquinol-cytochrome c reductase cytochrome b subunit